MCPSFQLKFGFCVSRSNMHSCLKHNLVVSPGLNHRVADFKSFKACRERYRATGRPLDCGWLPCWRSTCYLVKASLRARSISAWPQSIQPAASFYVLAAAIFNKVWRPRPCADSCGNFFTEQVYWAARHCRSWLQWPCGHRP